MVSSAQLRRLATRPSEYVRFVTTGQLPRGVRPQSPLIDLLKQVSPHDRGHIQNLVIDTRLGYEGSRQFATAAHAMHWLAPAPEVFASFPAESCRNKRFQERLYLHDLVAAGARVPDGLLQRYPRLRRPVADAQAGSSVESSDEDPAQFQSGNPESAHAPQSRPD